MGPERRNDLSRTKKSKWCSCFRKPRSESLSKRCQRWFNPRSRRIWPFSKIWPQSSTQENRQELTDEVPNSMALQKIQVPHTSSSEQLGLRGGKKTSMGPAAAVPDSMPATLNTQVPMNIFASCEEDCSSPTCVLRYCILTLTKLLIYKELAKEISHVVIGVKIQGSKNILRSDEILVPPSGQVKANLALSFSLQYPHSLKREGNNLQILLQQKQRLKNQAILGYKTLAMGTINLAELMLRPLQGDQMLRLHSTITETSAHVAEISISSLSSQPIESEDSIQQAGLKAKSRVCYSEQQASHDPRLGQDEEEEDINFWEPKKQLQGIVRMPPMTRKQYAINKVGVWLHRAQVWEEEVNLEEESWENITEEEDDLDVLYDSLENLSDSGS